MGEFTPLTGKRGKATKAARAALVTGGSRGIGRADLADPAAAGRLFDRATELLGPLDILVNNAGVVAGDPIADTTDEVLRDRLGPGALVADHGRAGEQAVPGGARVDADDGRPGVTMSLSRLLMEPGCHMAGGTAVP